MVLLRPVISVREIPPNCASLRSELPSIRSLVSEQPCLEEKKILQYLQQGVFGCFYPDPRLARDVLEPGNKVNLSLLKETLGRAAQAAAATYSTALHPSSVLTDGVWLWPSVLAYYVAKYHVQVDPEFIDHARAHNWTIRESEISLEDLSFDAFSVA